MARFIDLLGYREIALKSDTEPAIIAFRNRVKGDKPSNGLIDNSVMLLRGIVREVSRKRRTLRRLASPAVLGGPCRQHPAQVPERSPLEKSARQEAVTRVRPMCWEGVGVAHLNRIHEQNPRYKFGMWAKTRNNNAKCFIGIAEGVFRAPEI